MNGLLSVCAEKPIKEVRISDCPNGCKVYVCASGHEMVIHNPAYGCRS
jgi:hypothetical protein